MVERDVLSHFSHVWLFATPWTVCKPPGSSVHGILQARILEWVAMPCSRGSSPPRDHTCISCGSCVAGRFFTTEPLGSPKKDLISIINMAPCIVRDQMHVEVHLERAATHELLWKDRKKDYLKLDEKSINVWGVCYIVLGFAECCLLCSHSVSHELNCT